MSDSNSSIGGVPDFLYLDLRPLGLSGRGGAVRFFMTRKGIKRNETLVSFADWRAEVKSKVASSSNLMAHVPIITLQGLEYTEHHAILRFFSRLLAEYGTDVQRDFRVDRTASASNEMRDQLISGLSDAAAKDKYVARRAEFYNTFNELRSRDAGQGKHMVGDTPSFVDDVMFGILWDDTKLHGSELLAQTPGLQQFFDAYRAQPGVNEWCTAQK